MALGVRTFERENGRVLKFYQEGPDQLIMKDTLNRDGRQGYVLGQLHQKWWLQAGRK